MKKTAAPRTSAARKQQERAGDVPNVSALRAALRRWTRECIRPPHLRFRHPWLAPMALSAAAARVLAGRPSAGQRASVSGDGFSSGDYSLGLFHHDASEASIALLEDDEFRAREAEPSKPVIAQYALRCAHALGAEWADRHRVYSRVVAFQWWQERHLTGLHGPEPGRAKARDPCDGVPGPVVKVRSVRRQIR
ncbi:MAG: hypothetical protein EHM78_24980, partial [Myxococcaceae bacterium]